MILTLLHHDPPSSPSPAAGAAATLLSRTARIRSAPVLDVAGLIERITAGDLDAVLPLIAPVIGQRLRPLEAASTLSALSRFDIGDRVRINHTVKPSYLHEARGTVTGRAGQQVVLRLDNPVGRFTGEVCCPPQALEPLSAD